MSIGSPSQDHCNANRLTGPVLFDLGQELFHGAHALVLDGDDQVGGVRVKASANVSPTRNRATRVFSPAGCLGLARRVRRPDHRDHKQPFPGGIDPRDPQVGSDDPAVIDQLLEDSRNRVDRDGELLMPADWPTLLTIAVFMPITLPFEFSNGPPERPG